MPVGGEKWTGEAAEAAGSMPAQAQTVKADNPADTAAAKNLIAFIVRLRDVRDDVL
jgi:hypothetical protein